MSDSNQQTLTYISQLQQEELALYNSLDKPDLTAEEKQQAIAKINEISLMRLNLYGSIKDLLDTYKQNMNDSSNTLAQQIIAVKIMENQLDNAKKTLNDIDDEKATKIRLAEINTYYGKQYGAHTSFMKLIIIFCIPIFILAMIYNWGLLPPLLYKFLLGIVLIIAVILIGYKWIDINSRDNMNWDEYEWNFNPKNIQTTTSTLDSGGNNPWPEFNMTCIGAECCTEGTTFDEVLKKCVSATSVEGFESIEKHALKPVKSEGFNSRFASKKNGIKWI